MSLTKEVLQQFTDYKVFIETGTNQGRCVQLALDLGFKRVVTIEIDDELWKQCWEKFKEDDRVICFRGDSRLCLPMAMNVKSEAVVYLDAHSKGNDPVFGELEVIARYYDKAKVVIIDDWNDYKRREVEVRTILGTGYSYRIEDGFRFNGNTVDKGGLFICEAKE